MTEIKTRLTQAEQQALQAKLFALLARQVRNYTQGESDSVPVETAQALRESGQCLEEYLQAAKAS